MISEIEDTELWNSNSPYLTLFGLNKQNWNQIKEDCLIYLDNSIIFCHLVLSSEHSEPIQEHQTFHGATLPGLPLQCLTQHQF